MRNLSPIFLLFALLFSGCGYYPMAYYSKQTLGDSIYVDMNVSFSDPENSVIAKDALNAAIVTRFHSNLTSRDNAETIIKVDMRDISMYSISDSPDGFSNFYRVVVRLKFSYKNKSGKSLEFINTGSFDFPVDSLSTITDEKRFNAINEASRQAIDKFIAQVAAHWQ